MRDSAVRPLTLPSRWTIQPSQRPGVPWTLTERQRMVLYGPVWNDRQWFVQAVTATHLVLEAGHYFDWLLTIPRKDCERFLAYRAVFTHFRTLIPF